MKGLSATMESDVARAFATLSDPHYVPPVLPDAAMHLLRVARFRAADIPFHQLSKELERDLLLAARVLRAAQSPAYGYAPVRTLPEAAMRLGLRTLADIFLEAAVTSRVFQAPALAAPMARLRKHAVMTAHATRLVARGTNGADDAFLVGLLHNVGSAVMLSLLGDGSSDPDSVLESLAQTHELAGFLLVRAWQLPDAIAEVVAHHHTPKPGDHLAAALTLGRSLSAPWAPADETPEDYLVDEARELLDLEPGAVEEISGTLREAAAA